MNQNMSERAAMEKKLSVPALDVSFSSEAGEDVTLPDYYPEIRKVVGVFTKALPESKFLSGRVLETDGTVTASVLYLGEDGGLASAPVTTEYTAQTAVNTEELNMPGVQVESRVENVLCRVTGPRKLSLKYRLRHKLFAAGEVSAAEKTGDTQGGRLSPKDVLALEMHPKEIRTVITSVGSCSGGVSGAVRERGGMKPVFCDGVIRITEARAGDGTVNVRGEGILCGLFYAPDGSYVSARAKAAIEETVPVPALREGDHVRAFGRCVSASLSPDEGGNGEYHFEMEYELEAEGQRGVTVFASDDGYSTAAETELEFEQRDVYAPGVCRVSALSVSGKSPASSREAAAGEYLLGVWADGVAEELEISHGRYILKGSCGVKAVKAGGGEVWAEEFSVPFRLECEGEEGEGEALWRCDVSVVEATGRVDGDRISVNLELCISLSVYRKGRVQYLSGIKVDKTVPKGDSDDFWRVYYPLPGERLWDVAKRYRADPRLLAERNGIEGEILEEGRAVLLP